jgi:voltage-gated potassium channel
MKMHMDSLFKNKIMSLAFAVSIVASLLIVFVEFLFPLDFKQRLILDTFDLVIVILLGLDFYARFSKTSEKKLHFLLKHWFEIIAMIPLIVLLTIDPSSNLLYLRFLALFRLFRLYQILSILKGKGGELIILAGVSGISIIFGGFAVVIAELNNPASNIKNLSDGIWWAIATITTVGYGDYYPVTPLGKIIASFVMFIGLAFLTTFAGLLSSTLIAGKIKQNDNYSPGTKTLLNETKEFIRNRINEIERLDKEDLETLINVIKALNEKGMKNTDTRSSEIR